MARRSVDEASTRGQEQCPVHPWLLSFCAGQHKLLVCSYFVRYYVELVCTRVDEWVSAHSCSCVRHFVLSTCRTPDREKSLDKDYRKVAQTPHTHWLIRSHILSLYLYVYKGTSTYTLTHTQSHSLSLYLYIHGHLHTPLFVQSIISCEAKLITGALLLPHDINKILVWRGLTWGIVADTTFLTCILPARVSFLHRDIRSSKRKSSLY